MSYHGEYDDNEPWDSEIVNSSSLNSNDTDYTGEFENDETWDTIDDMVADLDDIAYRSGFFLSKSSSMPENRIRTPMVALVCKCPGNYRQKKQTSTRSGTKKTNCPFKIVGYMAGKYWKCYVKNGFHNHPPATYPQGHSRAGRLKEPEIEMAKALRKTSCFARAMLEAIKLKFPENVSNVQTIHNCMATYKMKEVDGRNQMQQLLYMLDKNHYTYYYDVNQETDTLQNLFFASPESMNLFRAFPAVMLMDCTYRTNRFNMPFLEFVGMTSTQQTFCVGFVFMRTETTENYIWPLQQLRVSLIGCVLPRVIVTDRDMALMNALEVVFPDSHHLLCTFHIAKNILANCRTIIPSKDWQKFLDKWHELVESETISEYNDNLNKLADCYSAYTNVLEYLGNLLREYGHKFVACHTNYTMHLGNRTSNRVEGQHSSLKNYLATNADNLESVWSNVNKIKKKQFTVIKRELERYKAYFPHTFNIPLFIYLRSSISHQALEDILEEQKRCTRQFGGECDCDIKLSHGLPCHHELSMHIALGQPISLESIQKFWKKIDVKDEVESNDDDGVDGAINEFRTVYSTKNHSEKYRMKKQLLDITVPSRTSMHEPEFRKTKERPKKGYNSTRRDKSIWEHIEEQVTQQSSSGRNKGKKKVEENPIPPRRSTLRPELKTPTSRTFLYSEQIWNKLHPYIDTVKDVVGDGNCGFRVIARVVGKQWGVDDWFEVRKDLQIELLTHKDTFFDLFEEACKGYDWMVDSFSWSDGTQMPQKDQLMHFPMCGYLIASCYNIPVVHLTMVCNGSATFLPAYSAPVMERNVPTVMVFVDGNHFVEVVPKQGVFPMPGIAPRWKNICNEEGLQWESVFRQNFQLYKALVRQEKKEKKSNRIDASYDNPCIVPDDDDVN